MEQRKQALKRRMKGLLFGDAKQTSLMFLLPSLLGMAGFVLIPFFDVVRRSFFSALGGRFVGLENYRSVLTNDAFQLAAANTGRFLGSCIPLLLLLSLLVALTLYFRPRSAQLFKTSFLLPMAVPVASVVFVWKLLFSDQGLLNGLLEALGHPAVSWMNGGSAFWVLVGSYIWKNLGYTMLLWLAGLASIPDSLFEAARVDGADGLRTFLHITLPLLLPTLYTILVLSLVNAFKVFREAYLVAGSYPHDSIYQLQHLFNNWFRDLDMDRLAAASVLVSLAILALILCLRGVLEEGREDE